MADLVGVTEDSLPIRISSAGTHALVGHPATEGTIRAAAEIGLDLSNHRSTQLTPQMAAAADLVFGMERHHVDFADRLGLPGRAHQLAGHPIDDPYGRSPGVYARVRDEIVAALEDRLAGLVALIDRGGRVG